MNILITAGNAQVQIDRVRVITNVFSGRTGANLALAAFERGHRVTLVTSHPEISTGANTLRPKDDVAFRVVPYRTFDDIALSLQSELATGYYDALLHAAAIADYRIDGAFAGSDGRVAMATAGKVKSHHAELWLKLVPTPKLIDRVREPWGFRGVLVKFKLEVGTTDAELLAIAERSRLDSRADLMVANTLEGAAEWAFVGDGEYDRVARSKLAAEVIRRVEGLGTTTAR